MTMKTRVTTEHPGAILMREFMIPNGISQTELSEHLKVSLRRVNEIVNGKREISIDTAILLSMAFSNTPEYWLALQMRYDLATFDKAIPVIGSLV
jgi:antitoxin HigA-1